MEQASVRSKSASTMPKVLRGAAGSHRHRRHGARRGRVRPAHPQPKQQRGPGGYCHSRAGHRCTASGCAGPARAERHLLGDAVRAAAAVGQRGPWHARPPRGRGRPPAAARAPPRRPVTRPPARRPPRWPGSSSGTARRRLAARRRRGRDAERITPSAPAPGVGGPASLARFSACVGVVLVPWLAPAPAAAAGRARVLGDPVDVPVGVPVREGDQPQHRVDRPGTRARPARTAPVMAPGLRAGSSTGPSVVTSVPCAVGEERAALEHERRRQYRARRARRRAPCPARRRGRRAGTCRPRS